MKIWMKEMQQHEEKNAERPIEGAMPRQLSGKGENHL
jgi:hypothetical protein